MKLFLRNQFILFFTCCTFFAIAQPAIEWEKWYGGSHAEWAFNVTQTTDKGFIMSGWADSDDGKVGVNNGSNDLWVVKVDSLGTFQWGTDLGGSNSDIGEVRSIIQHSDGGYVVMATTTSNDGDVVALHNPPEIWIVKLSSAGNLQWQKTFGGSGSESAADIQKTKDNGYIILGTTTSNNGDVSGNHNISFGGDVWVVKVDSTWSIQWQKCLGGSNGEMGTSLRQTQDGGYIIGAITKSTNGDVSGLHGSTEDDIWLVKLSGSGNIEWQKCLGGTGREYLSSVRQTSDGGYIALGHTASSDGDVTGNHGGVDIWVIKLSSTGTIEWQKCYGGSWTDGGESIEQTVDGGYIIAASTNSLDGDVTGYNYLFDIWIIKISNLGVIEWDKYLGGRGPVEFTGCIKQTSDGGYVFVGTSTSSDTTSYDFYIVKLGCYTSPSIASFTSDSSVCSNSTVNFTNSSVASNSWIWKLNNSTIDSLENTSYFFNTAGVYTVTLISQGQTCGINENSDSTSKIITVNDPTPVSILGLSAEYLSDASAITLTSSPTGAVFSDNGVVTSVFNPTLASFGSHTIVCIYTDLNGCIDSSSQTVTVNPISDAQVLFVPDAFSPNNDGNNDKLFVFGKNIQSLRFCVYDRWGEKVFETTTMETGWDGTYKNVELQPGVFVYYVEAIFRNSEKATKKGDVSLLR